MTSVQSSIRLLQWLAGEFSNDAQTLENPVWFVKLLLWHRPIPCLLGGHVGIFAEQANVMEPTNSYRQRVFTITEANGELTAQYFGFKNPQVFKGAGLNPALLEAVTLDDLTLLPGCVLNVASESNRFVGRMRPGDRCQFHYSDNTGVDRVGQVSLGFDVEAKRFVSYDKGIDPSTEKPIWGALMGPYTFDKVKDFSNALP
jgi:hypothetical protein